MTDSEDSHGDPHYHGDSDPERCPMNPEPPKELLDNQLIDADNIGGTVFSKHFVFTTLMKLIQAVDKETHGKEATEEGDHGLDLEENLQDDLCKLWDMAMNGEVVTFLQEFKAVDIFTGVISTSKAPRAVEICVGILGNMACNSEVCRTLAGNIKLRELLFLLLESPDTPTLVESTRLLLTVVSAGEAGSPWREDVKTKPDINRALAFILNSSTNVDLLSNAGELLDKLLDLEDELCVQWSTAERVAAILEAVKQIGHEAALQTYIHILQLLSTCEPGAEALSEHADSLSKLMQDYLMAVCADDILAIHGNEDTIGSVLAVLRVTFVSASTRHQLLTESYRLLRCLLKILQAVYTQLHPEIASHRDRWAVEDADFTRNRHRSVPHCRSSCDEPSDTLDKESKPSTGDTINEVRTSRSNERRTPNGRVEEEEKNEKEEEEKREIRMAELLCELLTALLVSMVAILDQLPITATETQSEDSSGDTASDRVTDPQSDTSQTTTSSSPQAADQNIQTTPPRCLDYLERMCERERITCMALVLHDWDLREKQRTMTTFLDVASRYNCNRIVRVVESARDEQTGNG